ncbi:AT-hook motif nuclear-localized protein 10 [Sesamum angolense]|uniref:AT-hook motif nuclear-localized protein n=1 Tax=Sesamum angolense TaxID=2727404 RepID=A0AAE1WAR6_9LAMI|nr:AT-hook motif nuclear-localized protein 10 [Sesamum angolense]
MDSQDSSAPPPHLSHHHHPQPLPPSHPGLLLGQHSQTPQHLPNNSYQLPNSNSSINPTTSATTNTAIMHQQNPRFPFNSMAAAAAAAAGQKPLDHIQSEGSPSGGGGAGFSIEPARKKRGRPRKYSPDNSIGLGLSPAPVSQISSVMPHNDSGGGGTPSSDTPAKRNRGRPPGSVKRQMDALGAPGVGFTPHVITVNAGEVPLSVSREALTMLYLDLTHVITHPILETLKTIYLMAMFAWMGDLEDIASKIMAFSQQGPRTVCILSANGAICNVTLRQPAMSGGTVTYEGRFEIISLSGSFLLSESNGNRSRTGGLSVSLAGSDGRVLGGGVAGMLKAASPVQVIVGSFIADGKKSKTGTSSTPSSHMLNFGAPMTGASPSPGASSESGEDNDDSPLNRGSGPYGNAGQPAFLVLNRSPCSLADSNMI